MSRFELSWSSSHPAIADLRSREQSVREAILSRGHSISTIHLLDFVREIVAATQTFVDNADFELAEVTALRSEMLLRNSSSARRRYNDEDWLNLGTATIAVSASKIEQGRIQLLGQTLQHIAFIYKMLGRYESAKLALLDAVELQGGDMRPQTMLNLLSIIAHLPSDETVALHIASEAVFALARELEALLAPALSSVLVNGTIAQRNLYTNQRHVAATLLVTAQLYLSDTARFRFVRLVESKAREPGRLYSLHRITLAYCELQRLATQELVEDHALHEQLAESVADWSQWLSDSVFGSEDERRMSNEKSEKWKFQVRRSRQFAAMNCVFVDGDFSALEYLYERYPHNAGVALLLLGAQSEPSQGFRTDRHLNQMTTPAGEQPPSRASELTFGRNPHPKAQVDEALNNEAAILSRGSLERQLAEVPSPTNLPPVVVKQSERSAYLHLSTFVTGPVVLPQTRRKGDTAVVVATADISPVPPPKPISAISSRRTPSGGEAKEGPPAIPDHSAVEQPLGEAVSRDASPEVVSPFTSASAVAHLAIMTSTGDGGLPSHSFRKLIGPTSRPASNDLGVPDKQAPLPRRRAPSDSAIR